jgi:hypothetical protein
MIDEMIRCEKLDSKSKIRSLCEWYDRCPPKGKLKHWKDGRSAKETAKHWLHTIPQPFKDLLKNHQLKYILCSPEFESKFDSYKNGRNHDLLILAKNNNSKNVVISIESKADEPFGDTVSSTLATAEKEIIKNLKSKALNRINELRIALFGELNDNQLEFRYQLLTAVAGTIAEAKNKNAKTAYFLVQTFIEQENNKHKLNNDDLNHFLSVFTKSNYTKLENNQILGPFRVAKGSDLISDDIELFIGKYEIKI